MKRSPLMESPSRTTSSAAVAEKRYEVSLRAMTDPEEIKELVDGFNVPCPKLFRTRHVLDATKRRGRRNSMIETKGDAYLLPVRETLKNHPIHLERPAAEVMMGKLMLLDKSLGVKANRPRKKRKKSVQQQQQPPPKVNNGRRLSVEIPVNLAPQAAFDPIVLYPNLTKPPSHQFIPYHERLTRQIERAKTAAAAAAARPHSRAAPVSSSSSSSASASALASSSSVPDASGSVPAPSSSSSSSSQQDENNPPSSSSTPSSTATDSQNSIEPINSSPAPSHWAGEGSKPKTPMSQKFLRSLHSSQGLRSQLIACKMAKSPFEEGESRLSTPPLRFRSSSPSSSSPHASLSSSASYLHSLSSSASSPHLASFHGSPLLHKSASSSSIHRPFSQPSGPSSSTLLSSSSLSAFPAMPGSPSTASPSRFLHSSASPSPSSTLHRSSSPSSSHHPSSHHPSDHRASSASPSLSHRSHLSHRPPTADSILPCLSSQITVEGITTPFVWSNAGKKAKALNFHSFESRLLAEAGKG